MINETLKKKPDDPFSLMTSILSLVKLKLFVYII